MCQHKGIECYRHRKCKQLCDAANEWADQDYVGITENALPIERLEILAMRNLISRTDAILRCPRIDMKEALSLLTEKQREAMILIFQGETDGPMAYREAAKRLGIHKNAVLERVQNALKKIAAHTGQQTIYRRTPSQGRYNGTN